MATTTVYQNGKPSANYDSGTGQYSAVPSNASQTTQAADAQRASSQVGAAITAGTLPGGTATPAYTPPTNINSDNSKPTPAIALPTAPIPSNLGTNTVTQLTGIGAATTSGQPAPVSSADTDFQTYLKNIAAPPKTADLYATAEADAGLQAKQDQVNSYQSQLNAITAKAAADKLSMAGLGRGIPETIIGGQQAQIDREAAIQALPVAAQLASAQADLKTAQDHVDTLFKLRAEDAAQQAAYQNKVVDAIYNYATDKQKALLDDKKTASAQAFTLMTNNLDYAQSLATVAIQNGQPGVASQIMKLDHNDPNYAANIGILAKGIHVTPKTTGTPTTLAERQASAVAGLQTILGSGQKLATGEAIKDPNGFMTPAAWNAFIAQAPSEGLDRQSFITNFGYLVYTDPKKGIPSSYKLTPAEQKIVKGKL